MCSRLVLLSATLVAVIVAPATNQTLSPQVPTITTPTLAPTIVIRAGSSGKASTERLAG